MSGFGAALWGELIKLRRSRVPLFTALGFLVIPLMGGFFMIILKDPAAARSMGLIGAKSQLTAGTADWPSYLALLAQAAAVGGGIIFGVLTTWVFGREFSDRTAKELLALPTRRETIVAAKFTVIAVWAALLTGLMIGLGLLVGKLVDIPGFALDQLPRALWVITGTAALTVVLMPFVALLASSGRGYLPPFGWMIATMVLAQVAALTGWGDWVPWSVPALFSGVAGAPDKLLGAHSYVLVLLFSLAGLAATIYWWRNADQAR